jgi:hypothetical protein
MTKWRQSPGGISGMVSNFLGLRQPHALLPNLEVIGNHTTVDWL